jgi:hypothetical protein
MIYATSLIQRSFEADTNLALFALGSSLLVRRLTSICILIVYDSIVSVSYALMICSASEVAVCRARVKFWLRPIARVRPKSTDRLW